MKPKEYWRDVPGTGGKYQASRNGEVRHVWPSGKITAIKPYLLRCKDGRRFPNQLHVHLWIDGKQRMRTLISVIASAWKGPLPDGMIWHHVNGNVRDNSIENIRAITRSELGRKTGGMGRRKSVEMLDADGNVVALYASAADAARANHVGYESVRQRCVGMVKNPYALMGYTFRYEDEPRRQRKKAGK